MKIKNFGRNLTLAPRDHYAPQDETEVIEILNRHRGRRIRCIGRLHSWSRLLDCDDVLLDLRHLNHVRPIQDGDNGLVSIGAGCQIKRVLSELKRLKSWTLPTVGFITEQTIAGATATGTHGSGRHSLSHYVTAVRIAHYDRSTGEAVIEEISDGEALRAARCSLGCLGIVLSVTMPCRPEYQVEEQFREYADLAPVLEAEKEFPLQQFYLVPWRWNYVAQHRRESAARPSRLVLLYHGYRFLVFDIGMHLALLISLRWLRSRYAVKMLFRRIMPALVLRNRRVVGRSTAQLVMEHERFRHVEVELFVKRDQIESALPFLKEALIAAADPDIQLSSDLRRQLALANAQEELSSIRGTYLHHYPICVRKIFADDTLISMTSDAGERREVVTEGPEARRENASPEAESWYSITLTNYDRGSRREPFVAFAAFLTRSMAHLFGARPHWGKLCSLSPGDFDRLYPAAERFRSQCERFDPDRNFVNRWIGEYLRRREGDRPKPTDQG